MITLLVEPGSLHPGALLSLPDAESHHLRVRRVSEGEPVRLADGEGTVGTGTLVAAARVAVVDVRSVRSPAVLELGVAAGDKERWGWLAEKAAELGVTGLHPVEMERTAGVATRVRDQHLGRLRQRAREAIKQSGAAWAPVIHVPVTLEEFCARPADGTRWLAERAGGRPAPVAVGTAVTALIGPEGGFTEREVRLARDAGFTPVRLAGPVLRFETAALAAAILAGSSRHSEEDT